MPEQPGAGDFSIAEEAPAKINLALHVTGRRDDGYHMLDTLVAFTRLGDRLDFRLTDKDAFHLSGPFAPALGDGTGGNLVIRARDLLRQELRAEGHAAPPVGIRLEKNLPVASGIGGGSADAAATLRGLSRLWNVRLPDATLASIAMRLGADVPMCLQSRPMIARGIGEEITPLPRFPAFPIVLGNPLVGVSTPAVFRLLAERANPPLAFEATAPRDRTGWLDLMAGLRNDLEGPARALAGEIADVSDMLAQAGARLVRMSGSGATCFGLFDSIESAEAARTRLHSIRPDWYFQATETAGSDWR